MPTAPLPRPCDYTAPPSLPAIVPPPVQNISEMPIRGEIPLILPERIVIWVCALVFGLLGLILVWPQASSFRSNGYSLKARSAWQLYWTGFALRLVAMVGFGIFMFVRAKNNDFR